MAETSSPAPDGEAPKLLKIILSVLIPPIGVFLQVGLTVHFWINLVLTLLGYIPGLVHAIWVIASEQQPPA